MSGSISLNGTSKNDYIDGAARLAALVIQASRLPSFRSGTG